MQDKNYSWTECTKNFVINEAGCYIDWFDKMSAKSVPRCNNLSSLLKLQEWLLKIKSSSLEDLISGYGCYQSCSKKRHIVWDTFETDLTWHTDWVSEVKRFHWILNFLQF